MSTIPNIDAPAGPAPTHGDGIKRFEGVKHPSGAHPSPESLRYVFEVPDQRVLVPDTTIYPYRGVALLIIDTGGPSPRTATGWFFSPYVLITAAHALTFKDDSGATHPVHRVRVVPGMNGTAMPYGIHDSASIKVSSRWPADPSADYGAIRLSEPVGNTVGWFGSGAFTDDQFRSAAFTLAGYPVDKPRGTMWMESGAVAPMASQLQYKMGVIEGQSGGPLFAMINGSAWAGAIVSGGDSAINQNTAVRITAAVDTEIKSWLA